MRARENRNLLLMVAPAIAVGAAFFLLPLARLAVVGASGPLGPQAYLKVVTNAQYFHALLSTIVLSVAVTATTLVIAGIAGVFLERNRFLGREALLSMLTLPLAFPGVVVGFMVIMLAGRTGIAGELSSLLGAGRLVFAYSMAGLFMGYLYFSIPRVILTIMAAAEKLDPALEEAARSLGAGPWRVVRDVILPALSPALIASGAICFSTSMGAFGTAFTLATDIKVLPIVIYTEFTLLANIALAAALSMVLGIITWATLASSRALAGTTAAAAG
ncbi:MAG: ABC transporter permease [candidate division NC10 bacterium]|nr:ABC transporter permease [candidate division NC10 bacterium]